MVGYPSKNVIFSVVCTDISCFEVIFNVANQLPVS